MESQEALVGVPAPAPAVSERMENLGNDKSLARKQNAV
jgi:hypothetical protein